MKKRKQAPTKTILSIILLAVCGTGAVLHLGNLKLNNGNNEGLALMSAKNIPPYPTLYSDKHITENAKVSDPKWNNIAFHDAIAKNNLANSLNSIPKKRPGSPTPTPENGTWLWTPILDITPAYRTKIISSAKREGIKNVYTSIDSYLDLFVLPDGEEKIKKIKDFDNTLEAFVLEASKSGITVDVEAGWRNWAETGHEYKALAVLNYATAFNNTHTTKLRGFEYDVEPYLLDAYQVNKKPVLQNFVSLVEKTINHLIDSDLELSVVVPEFFDGQDSMTPKIYYNGIYDYTFEHLLTVLDKRPNSKIIVMSYRNFALGEDGSIDISKDEINSANKHQTSVVLAQETGEVKPSYVTFYGTSKKYYRKQLGLLQDAFATDSGFGGIATHYINALMSLK